MIKIYSSKYFYFSFKLKVGAAIRSVVINGGSYFNGKQVNGSFVTGNEELIKALEDSVYFKNGTVFLVNPNGTRVSETNNSYAAKENKAVSSAPVSEQKEGEAVSSDAKVYDCKTIQAASRILNSEYDIPFSQVNSKEKVLAKAKELNIVFENIK